MGNVRESIDGHDDLQSKLSGILDMLGKVLDSFFEDGKVLVEVSVMQRPAGSHLWSAAMHFQGSSGCDDYDRIGNKTADPALDIAKLLHAHVGTETAFSQHIALARGVLAVIGTRELECHSVCKNGRVSMGNICERSCMYEDWGTLICRSDHNR